MNEQNLLNRRKFSKDYQPKSRRQSAKILTELLTKKLNKRSEIIVQGKDIETGELRRIRVENPTKEVIVTVLLSEAAKGNIAALREVFDRIEGKPIFTAEVDIPGITSIGFDGD